jgi:hypothetical protein
MCHEIFDLLKVEQPLSLTLAVDLEQMRISSRIFKEKKTKWGFQYTQGPEEDDSDQKPDIKNHEALFI